MRLEALPIPEAFSIEAEPLEDERGYFARVWCQEEFARVGLQIQIVQVSVSFSHRAGTLRGMHFSRAPSCEGKIVRCQRGRVHDVLLDLRADSPSLGRHVAVVLDATRHNAVYIPPGVAHGFQTLVDDCEVCYMMTDFYRPELGDGVRFDDPSFAIQWPLPVRMIAERDRAYPDYIHG